MGRASFDTRSAVVSFIQEQLPFRDPDAIGIADERQHRQNITKADFAFRRLKVKPG